MLKFLASFTAKFGGIPRLGLILQWGGYQLLSRKRGKMQLRSQLIANRKSHGLSISAEVNDLERSKCIVVTGNQT